MDDGSVPNVAVYPPELLQRLASSSTEQKHPLEANDTRNGTKKVQTLPPIDLTTPETQSNLNKRDMPPISPYPQTEHDAIFYNVYMPFDSYVQRDILKGQFKHILNSSWHSSPIYYNVISKRLPDIGCKYNLTCRRLGTFKQGWEDLTLSSLLRHCHRHPNATVVYIHNKGSYNMNPNNAKTRELATKAVLSDACRDMHPFNVCGLRFSIIPYMHFSTNMFAARCDYVQHLVPPSHYSDLREYLCRALLATHNDQECNMTLYHDDKANGYGRYAMERWLLSHPMVRPCDVLRAPMSEFETGHEEWTPHAHPPDQGGLVRPNTSIRRKIKLILRQFYFLYGEISPPNGFCRTVLNRVVPPVCGEKGPGVNFESIYNHTVLKLIQEFHSQKVQ